MDDQWHEARAMVDGEEETLATAPAQTDAIRAGLEAVSGQWIRRGIVDLIIYRCANRKTDECVATIPVPRLFE